MQSLSGQIALAMLRKSVVFMLYLPLFSSSKPWLSLLSNANALNYFTPHPHPPPQGRGDVILFIPFVLIPSPWKPFV